MKILFSLCTAFFCSSLLCAAQQPQPINGYYPIQGPELFQIDRFLNIPFAEERGIILETKQISIPEVKDPYNPSLVRTKTGFCIAFREDLPWDRKSFKHAHIGLIDVDKYFSPIGSATFLSIDEDKEEDPRLLWHNNELYVTYTHLTLWAKDYLCNIGLSKINLEEKKAELTWDLLYKRGPMEKNWAPFSYTNNQGKSELYFVYEYNPFTVIRAADPINGQIEHPFSPLPYRQLGNWEKKWGKICGGTPAILLENGEYLAFFHSRFRDKCLWYVIGAITFDGKPPFKIRSISPTPLLFKGMYMTPIAAGRNRSLRALFPGGVAQATRDGKKVLHLLCGDNDTAIRLITLDQTKLLQSMKSVSSK